MNQDLVIKVLEDEENQLHLKMLISEERLKELEAAHQEAWENASGIAELIQRLGKAASNINEFAFMVLQAGAILSEGKKESNDNTALLEAIEALTKKSNDSEA